METFVCSSCHCKLTHDDYFICVNRTCQTVLSALIDQKMCRNIEENLLESSNVSNVSYLTLTHRTVSIQVDTLAPFLSDQRNSMMTVDENDDEDSTSSSFNSNWPRTSSSDSSFISCTTSDSEQHHSQDWTARHLKYGFNSNQPIKSARLSEEEKELQRSSPTRSFDRPPSNTMSNASETPTSPRCLAIMNVRQRRDRLSTLINLPSNKISQTQLTCTKESFRTVSCENIPPVTMTSTHDSKKHDRQFQANTFRNQSEDQPEVQIDISDRLEKDSLDKLLSDDKILTALTEKDGQRWTQFIEQLTHESSLRSPNEIAQRLLDRIEYLHNHDKLNSLTSGQLQRKIRFAMSQLQEIAEQMIKTNRSSKNPTDCSGKLDMAVTVRQVDQRHNRQSSTPVQQSWKSYVDRLFDQGNSADEIQRSLREAATTSVSLDQQKLQEVFDYINAKSKQPRATTAPAGIEFVSKPIKTKGIPHSSSPKSLIFESNFTPRSSKSTGSPKTSKQSSFFSTNKEANKSRPVQDTSIPNDKSPRNSITQTGTTVPTSTAESHLQIDSSHDSKLSNQTKPLSATAQPISTTSNVVPQEASPHGSDQRVPKDSNSDNKSKMNELANDKLTETEPKDSINQSPSVHSDDIKSMNPKERCLYSLRRVRSASKALKKHRPPSISTLSIDDHSPLNKLIDSLESQVSPSSNVDDSKERNHLIAQVMNFLSDENSRLSSTNQTKTHDLNGKISDALNALRDYQKFISESTTESIPLNQVTDFVQSIIRSTEALQRITTDTDDQQIARPIRCTPIPYTTPNQKPSAVTLDTVQITSKENLLQPEQVDQQEKSVQSLKVNSSKVSTDVQNDPKDIDEGNESGPKIPDLESSTTPDESASSVSNQKDETNSNKRSDQSIRANYEILPQNQTLGNAKSIITPNGNLSSLKAEFILTEPRTSHRLQSSSRLDSAESSKNSVIPMVAELQESKATLINSKIDSKSNLSNSKSDSKGPSSSSATSATSQRSTSTDPSKTSLSMSMNTKEKEDDIKSQSSVHSGKSNEKQLNISHKVNDKLNTNTALTILNRLFKTNRFLIPTPVQSINISQTTIQNSIMIKLDENKDSKLISKASSHEKNQSIDDQLYVPVLIPPNMNSKQEESKQILSPSQILTEAFADYRKVSIPETRIIKPPSTDRIPTIQSHDEIIPVTNQTSASDLFVNKSSEFPLPSAPTDSQEILETESNESISSMADRALEKPKEESVDKNENDDDHQYSQTSSKYSENDPEMNPSSDGDENHSKSDLTSNRSHVPSSFNSTSSMIDNNDNIDEQERSSVVSKKSSNNSIAGNDSSKVSSTALEQSNSDLTKSDQQEKSKASSTAFEQSNKDVTKSDENSSKEQISSLKTDHDEVNSQSSSGKTSLEDKSLRSNAGPSSTSSLIDDTSSKKSISEQLDQSKTIQPNVEPKSSSTTPVKQNRSVPSATAVRASSLVNLTPDEDLNMWTPANDDEKNRSSSSIHDEPENNISRLNLLNMFNQTPEQRSLLKSEQSSSSLSKSSRDDRSKSIHSKKPLSLSNSSIDDRDPAISTPKLLKQRSSLKSHSSTVKLLKRQTSLSISDISSSSSNTVVTDYLSGSHRTTTDRDETKIKSKKSFVTQKLGKESMKNSSVQMLKTKMRIDRNVLSESQPINESLPKSDDWMKSQDDVTEILIIDEHQSTRIPKGQRKLKKTTKNQLIDRSALLPINLKARGDHQAHTIESSRLPSIEQSAAENRMKKWSHDSMRRKIICFPVSQIEKFECGTIGPRDHPSSITRQLLSLPSICDRSNFASGVTNSLTDRFYSLLSSDFNENDEENVDDEHVFDSIVNWEQEKRRNPCSTSKTNQTKFQFIHLLENPNRNATRGRQYPIVADEIDLIDDPNSCTIMNKWAFADLVETERKKFVEKSENRPKTFRKKLNVEKNFQICFRKRPLTEFEEKIFKEVDIISVLNDQNLVVHIPSITVDNQVFLKNRKYHCDQTFDESTQMSTIYHSTIAPLIDQALEGNQSLCLISGGKYSGKTYLLRSLIDLISFDLIRLLSTCDVYVRLIGICHNRLVDILQNNSPIRLVKSSNWKFYPDEEFQLQNDQDIEFLVEQIKKRRRYVHQSIEIHFRVKDQSKLIGSLMIVVFASSQFVYTRTLCSHRRKFLINSLNRTILAFRRALLGIRQNPQRIQSAFNHDILTRLIRPYIFNKRSKICYIGTLNPGHRHRIATKSTLDFARNLRFCLKTIEKRRSKGKINSNASVVVHDRHDEHLL